MRKRAASHVNFVKIVNTEEIWSAGTTDFVGVFGVRLVDTPEYVKFVHAYIKN